MIEINNISKSFKDKKVLFNISGKFEKGKTNLIIGSSGTGKSVLLKCLVGLLEPDKGSVLFDGRDFTNANKNLTNVSLGMSVEEHSNKFSKLHKGKLPSAGLYSRIINEVERPLISICLNATKGNQIKASKLLGLNRNTLRKKIKELKIKVL